MRNAECKSHTRHGSGGLRSKAKKIVRTVTSVLQQRSEEVHPDRERLDGVRADCNVGKEYSLYRLVL